MKPLIFSFSLILIFLVGFILGRNSQKENVVFVHEKTTRGSVPAEVLIPVKTARPVFSQIPFIYFRTDTILKENVLDSAKIVEDFLQKKDYNFPIFDDNRGKLIARPTVQFNQLINFNYTFTPIQQKVYIEKKIEPFIFASYNTLHGGGIGGGVFIKKIGFSGSFNFDKSTGIRAFYKF